MIKRCILFLVVLAFTFPVFGLDATMAVNGATNPSGITDDNAYASVFRMMGSLKTKTTLANKVALVNFSNPNDVIQFENNMQAFQTQSSSGTQQNPVDQIALARQYEGQLSNQLTSTGFNELLTFIRAKKVQMATWTLDPNFCPPGTVSTYFDTTALDYGDSNSSFEFYGDGYSTRSCSCGVFPTSAYLTYQTIQTNGTIQGMTATVTKVAANQATTPFADSGTIYQVTYHLGFFNSCTGYNININWTTQSELAYTKFANMGLRAGGGCVGSGPGLVCSWEVAPICSNTAAPDYKYPGGPPPDAWFRDYDFAAWRSVAACSRVVWGTGHSAWLCQNLVLLTIGTSDVSSGICSNNP